MSHPSRMDEQHEVWENWAQADPLWAILSDPAKRGGRWDIEEFFASGRPDIEEVLGQVAALGVDLQRQRSLDFGCGVGRLSLALAEHFDRVDGVDISETMVELAQKHNRYPQRVDYHVNRQPDLSLFPDESFDFVFTTIVLQHNPPEIVREYIAEFIRILRPAGIAAFDMTASLRGADLPEGSHQARLQAVVEGALEPGEQRRIPVTVTNASPHDWPAGARTAVGNHWVDPLTEQMVVQDDGRAPLPDGLPASSSVTVDLMVTAPEQLGDYLLAVDVVEEGICWFGNGGSPVTQHPVRVQRRPLRALVKRLMPSKVSSAPPEPRPFDMNGLSRDEVFATVAASGGSVLGCEPSHRGGNHWDGYRYFVGKGSDAPDA